MLTALEVKDAFAPIPITPQGRALKNLREEYQAWAERTLIKPMSFRTQGQPWHEEAIRFARHTVQDLVPSSDQQRSPVLLRAMERLEAAGCRDPLFLFLAGHLKGDAFPNRLMDQACYQAALPAAQALPGPKLLVWFIERQMCTISGMNTDADRRRVLEVVQLTGEILSDGSVGPEDDELFYRLFTGGIGEQFRAFASSFIPVTEAIPNRPWLQKMLRAHLELQLAEFDRVNGEAHDDQSRLDSSAARTKSARRLLLEAWELRPERPEASARLISIDGWGNFAQGRVWFDRAVKAEFDCEEAYLRIIDLCRAENGGSLARQLACAKACVATQRYDTIVPMFFNLILSHAAQKAGDWREIYRRPDLAEMGVQLSQALVDEPTRQGDRQKNLQFLAVNAFLAGDFARAAQARRQAPGELSANAQKKLETLGIRDFDTQLTSLAERGDNPLAKAEAARTSAEPSQTYAALQEAGKRSGAAERVRLQPALARAAFLAAFATGDWVFSEINEENPAWRGAMWDYNLNNPAQPLTERRMRGYKVVHAFPVGDAFELRAEVPLKDGPAGKLLSCVFLAHRGKAEGPPYPPCSDSLRVELGILEKGRLSVQVRNGGGKTEVPDTVINARSVNVVQLRREDNTFRVEVNGVVITEQLHNGSANFESGDDQVFGFDRDPEALVTPLKVAVRKVVKDPAGGAF